MGAGNYRVTAGFMPLLDGALLIAAKEKGFAAAEGVDLSLVRENSWANIRDRLAVGHFQMAHVLAPMPIACNLGLTPLAAPTIVPMALGLGGNAVTVSHALWTQMAQAGAPVTLEPAATGQALRAVVDARMRAGQLPLRFAVVHPHSGHNYELRYWLAACGIDPERDVEIVIVPPPLTADALGRVNIDGFCAGEPWNTAAVAQGHGRIVTIKSAIWRSSPEKVLSVSQKWSEDNPEALTALLRALCNSARWCAEPSNHAELAVILSSDAYLARPAEWMLPALTGRLHVSADETRTVDDFFIPFARAATFPWKSHALWFYTQMVRWGQVSHDARNASIVGDTYRPELYRAALGPLGIALPVANSKVEGALRTATPVGSAGASLVLGPDGFFDGKIFDPDHLDDYIASLHPAAGAT